MVIKKAKLISMFKAKIADAEGKRKKYQAFHHRAYINGCLKEIARKTKNLEQARREGPSKFRTWETGQWGVEIKRLKHLIALVRTDEGDFINVGIDIMKALGL